MSIGTPWIFWTGLGVGGLGLLGLLWALFADWLRGRRTRLPRRRCPRCWYDMSAVPGRLCPECGRSAKSDRKLTKSRRRWRWVALSAACIAIGAAGVMNGPVRRINWLRVAPSTILVHMLDDPTIQEWDSSQAPPPQTLLREEVLRRYAAGKLSLSQRRALAAKQFVPGLPPVSTRTRRVWRLGTPITAEVHSRFAGVLPRTFEARATFEGALPIVAYHGGATLYRSGRGGQWRNERLDWAGGLQTLGTPPGELEQIEFEGRVLEGGDEIWRGRWTERIRVLENTEGAGLVFGSTDLDPVVRRAVEETLRLTDDRRALTMIMPPDRRIRQTGVSLDITILRQDERVATAEISWDIDGDWAWLLDDSPDPGELPDYVREILQKRAPLQGESSALRSMTPSIKGWTVRVRGSPALFERSTEFDAYWSGEFDLPLSTLLGDESE